MQQPKLTKHSNELVVIKEAWTNLILGFPILIIFAVSLFSHEKTKPFFKENLFATIVTIIIFLIAFYFLIRSSFDRKIKMVINKKGIWTYKNGLNEWEKIQYYYFEEIQSDNDTSYLLKFKLLNQDNETKLNISNFNKSEHDIEVAITNNCGENKIYLLK